VLGRLPPCVGQHKLISRPLDVSNGLDSSYCYLRNCCASKSLSTKMENLPWRPALPNKSRLVSISNDVDLFHYRSVIAGLIAL